MAVAKRKLEVKLEFADGRVFSLGTFNQAKNTYEQVARMAARKFKNLIGKLECGDALLTIGDKISVPVSAIKEDL